MCLHLINIPLELLKEIFIKFSKFFLNVGFPLPANYILQQ